MIIVLKHQIKPIEKDNILFFLTSNGFQIREIVGEEETVIGAVGVAGVDVRQVEVLPGVAKVIPISKPYKLASRELQKEDTVVRVGDVAIGGKRIVTIAGPCAVESQTQIMEIAELVAKSGATLLRGGAYKPRTSPYAFQGLEEEGLKYLKLAGEKWGMPVVTEVTSNKSIPVMMDYVDIFQVGARNMQNFELLKQLGTIGKPILLKRGFAATLEEWLMSAEYLMSKGATDVILCERGIRTFETATRNTLDLGILPVAKKLTHLPIIVDPSHATGLRDSVIPLSLAAVASGAHGLEIEVHNCPEKAFSDGPQSLYPEQFEKLMRDIQVLAPVVNKEIARKSYVDLSASKEVVSPTGSASKTIKVAFQGEHGAYSEAATLQYFDSTQVSPTPYTGFKSVYDAVLNGECEYGVLPIENSLAGSVHENYDLILQYPDIKIVGETRIRIEHNLIALEGSDINTLKRVYSHPQALMQCAEFLDAYPQIERIPVYDTSGAVKRVLDEGSKESAAIGSARAAALWKLPVLKSGLETNPNNYTRFVVIQKGEALLTAQDTKISLAFSLQDKPGSLFSIVSLFEAANINLSKIESRPIHGKPWAYKFYLDLEINNEPKAVEETLAKVANSADKFRILGYYKSSI